MEACTLKEAKRWVGRTVNTKTALLNFGRSIYSSL